jgi:hypothetical protein
MIKRKIMLILFLLVNFSYIITGNNNQYHSSGISKIHFVDNNEDQSKTYLGKLIKGDIDNLKLELKNNFADPPASVSDRNKTELDGYIDRITAEKQMKKWKKNGQKANNDLLGNYEVNDEKSLQKVKEKQLKQKEKRSSDKDISGNYKKYTESKSTRLPNSYLSKHYRIIGKRIHDGQTFKKRAGYVCLIIKYKIREGNYINTYVSVVEDYLKDGSKYNLKYHGNDSKRKYYLEYVSGSKSD